MSRYKPPVLCENCGRVLVPGKARRWVHRSEDFMPDLPIDCFSPQPEEQS